MVLVVVTPTIGIGVAYTRWRLGQINRVDVPGLTDDGAGQMNVLLVGSDNRARLTGDAAEQAGQVPFDESERSDTIMVLHIDTARKKAAIVSIPRDLYLPIAGTGRSDRVNTAFSIGGAEGLIATLQESLGIRINHFAEVDFVGFEDIVDAIGGVSVFVPAPARDAFTGLQIDDAGCHELDGTAALAWVRSRHFEYLSQGKWVEDGRADLGRIERQQDFIRRLMKKAVSSASSPLTLNRLIGIGAENLTIDSTMSTGDITTLARRFDSVDPDAVQTFTLPGTGARVGDMEVLMLDQAAAQAPLDLLNGRDVPGGGGPESPPATAAPSGNGPGTVIAAVEASIEVLNGTDTRGAAAKVAGELEGVGFTVSGTDDALDPATRPVIRYRDGQQAEAEALASAFKTAPELKVDPTVETGNLVLVVGTDYDGLRTGVTVGAPTTVTSTPAPVPVPVPVPVDSIPYRDC